MAAFESAAVALLVAVVAVATDDATRVHVVSVRRQTGAACVAKCTGFMMTQRAVLTAASCAGPVAGRTTTTTTTTITKALRSDHKTGSPHHVDAEDGAVARVSHGRGGRGPDGDQESDGGGEPDGGGGEPDGGDGEPDGGDGEPDGGGGKPDGGGGKPDGGRKPDDNDDGDDDNPTDVTTDTAAVTGDTVAEVTGPTAKTVTLREKNNENGHFSKTVVKIKCPPNSITVSLHNKEYIHTEIRMVTEKYVHPDWNPETHVADLAVLIIDNIFSQFKYINFPYMIGNDKKSVPETLYFRGFAAINLHMSINNVLDYKHGLTGIPDALAKRTIAVELSPDACPMVENGTLNPNWWSFLCTKPENARTNQYNTLCNEDIGGPLYALESDQLWLYGVYSHAYHAKYPFCAHQQCYWQSEAPYPCGKDTDSGTHYRHTALLGRYSSWLRRVAETYARPSTAAPKSECTTESGADRTTDPLYDAHLYDGRRPMEDNRRVCPPDQSRTAVGSGSGSGFGVAAAAVVTALAAAAAAAAAP